MIGPPAAGPATIAGFLSQQDCRALIAEIDAAQQEQVQIWRGDGFGAQNFNDRSTETRTPMAVPPADLSQCDTCKRPVPPSNNPQFAKWRTVKGETGRVSGMRCPECQAETAEAS